MQEETQALMLSKHAMKRMQQRSLSAEDVSYVLRHGQKQHAAHARIYFLRDKDVPKKDRRLLGRLCGAAIVVANARPIVITVWRNRTKGLRYIKRKSEVV